MINLSLAVLVVLGCQDSKMPVPSDEALAQAEKTIREVFRDEYAVRTTTAQFKLAKTLLRQGLETTESAALRYVLFREAADISLRSGDIENVLQALNELVGSFEVDPVHVKAPLFMKADSLSLRPEDFKSLAEAEFKLVGEALDRDQYEIAGKLAQSALMTARKTKDLGMVVRGDGLVKSVSDLRGSADRAKRAEDALASAPDDPASNQVWGDYLCLSRGQWQKGLGFLSKGSEGPMKALAQKELAAPSDLTTLVSIGDGWSEIAEREKVVIRKRNAELHSRGFYEAALPLATGLIRTKIERRLQSMELPVPREGDPK